MIEYYEQMTEAEQKELSEVIEHLYKQTFLLEHIYDKRTNRSVINKAYYICEKHLPFVKTYFAIMKIEVIEHAQMGIIYLRNEQVMGEHLSRLSTLYVLVLKLIYDEQMAAVSSSANVVTTLGMMHEKLALYGLLEKEPAISKIKESLRLLKKHQVISVPDSLESLDGYSKIVVYPTVNVLMMGDDVRAILKEFVEEGETEDGGKSEI